MIALVVTIIVLIILAGVSIQMLTGENGIIAKVQHAKNETEKAKDKEEQDLAILYNKMLLATEGNIPNPTEDPVNFRAWLDTVIQDDVSSINSRLTALENSNNNSGLTMNQVVDKLYPVGSIYISTAASINPGETDGIFEGTNTTWAPFGAGKTIIGAGQNTVRENNQDKTYTFTVGGEYGELGATTNPKGEYQHKLDITEMPSHNHTISDNYGKTTMATANDNWGAKLITINNGETMFRNNSISMLNTGGDANGNTVYHNNIQPYVTVYMWQRTN